MPDLFITTTSSARLTFGDAAPSPLPNTALRYTMGYGDPLMIELFNLTCEGQFPSNFNHYDGWSASTYWNAVSAYWKNVDYQFLKDIQPRDGSDIRNQMNWLVNHDETTKPTRPLWYKEGLLRCGHHVMGHNAVLVEADENGVPIPYIYTTSYPTTPSQYQEITFYNALGMPASMRDVIRSEIAQGIDPHKKYPWWIHRANSAIWDGHRDKLDWFPAWRDGMASGGTIFYVFWSKADWETNTGTQKMLFAANALWETIPPDKQPPPY